MELNGAAIVVEMLINEGVDIVFGYPGGTILNIYDELHKNSHRIKHYLTAHEQGAAHAADGYARSTGKVGVVMATSGPGATNLVTGIATAFMDSTPLVAITCNVPGKLLGKDSFQEIDIVGVTAPITKHNWMVKDIRELADTLRLAFATARSGRMGPVLVDITKDATAAVMEWIPEIKQCSGEKKQDWRFSPKPSDIIDASELAACAAMIAASERPFIYAGGGVIASGASAELKALVEKINAPYALSFMGHGALSSNHEHFTGMIGMHGTKASNLGASNADLLIAIGARFSDRVVSDSAKFAQGVKVLHIDIDKAEISKNIHCHQQLIGDIKASLSKLTPMLSARAKNEWNEKVASWSKEIPSAHHRETELHPRLILKAIYDKFGDDTIICTEVGQHQMWTSQFYPFSRPRTFISSGGLGTMGFGTGAAIGCQIGNPNRQVVHIAGDGSFRMNSTELATIAHYNLPILIVIMNNGTLGMVRQWQSMFYAGRFSHTTLDRPPDFVKLADAYGIGAARAKNKYEFEDILSGVTRQPYLIEALIDIDERVLPMVPSGKPIQDLILEPV